jgi:glycosyltransferase involved in cell wall biosynthesis
VIFRGRHFAQGVPVVHWGIRKDVTQGMKIGIDIRTLSFRRGGISQYTYHLLKNLLAVDAKNTYYLFNYNRSPYDWDHFRGNAREIILRCPQRSGFKTFWENVLVPLAVRKKGIQLWFSPDFAIPRLLRTRSVITVHDLIFEEFHDIRKSKDPALLSKRVEDSVRRANKIIAISDFTRKKILKRYGVPAEKVILVPQAADERFHRITDQMAIEAVLRRYGIDSKFLLFVGEISERKNLIRLLNAYYLLHQRNKTGDRKLILVGKKTADTPKILRKVSDLGLESRVLFTGYIPDEDLPFIYNGADLFVFPSLYEGFGMPPLEAMRCKVPVVASSATSIPEVVGTGALLFDPYNVDDIAGKIEQVLDQKIDTGALLQAASKQANQFSWERSARKTIALLESLHKGFQG